jgi:hypothetical protein
MRIVARHLWIVALLLSGGCEQSKVKAPESLVGAKHLPSASKLSRETIQINRWGGPRRDHLLTYELRPDNSLIVTHILQEPGGDKALAREAFALAPDAARQVRSTLSRVHPEALRGIEYVGYPVGCQPPTDSVDEVAIAFIDERKKIGIFDLPHVCKDGNAASARSSIAAVMKALPTSKVASAFPQSA